MKGFSLSVGCKGAPLHAAAHSHHPWPDVSFEAQRQAWLDAAELLDRKWDYVFSHVIPSAQAHLARQLSLPDASTIAFGPNTHGFVLRILSSIEHKPIRILTTDGEFLSFARQIARLEEDGIVSVKRIASEPFANFVDRFAEAAGKGGHDLVFFSQVFFNSAYAVCDLAHIVNAVMDPSTFVVIDGYHGFMALPTDLSAVASRAFYLAGGYKYAMAGEGACFLHCPPGYGTRPRDTGWYAGYGTLESGGSSVSYASDGSRFLGATFDVSPLYRFNAVQDWLKSEGMSVASMLDTIRMLERTFLASLDRNSACINSSMLAVRDDSRRGRFLAFQTPRAAAIASGLAAKDVIVDHRRNKVRIGLGIYHDEETVLRLAAMLS
jgi:selenocysteine lyase/cysteine desulfurase